jgi:hypothetical protein
VDDIVARKLLQWVRGRGAVSRLFVECRATPLFRVQARLACIPNKERTSTHSLSHSRLISLLSIAKIQLN